MKILLVCAGGLSSSIVMKKVRKYGEEVGKDITIDAVGVSDVREASKKGYDCVLTAPQVRNRFESIEADSSLPIAAMKPQDYALAHAENIINLAESII